MWEWFHPILCRKYSFGLSCVSTILNDLANIQTICELFKMKLWLIYCVECFRKHFVTFADFVRQIMFGYHIFRCNMFTIRIMQFNDMKLFFTHLYISVNRFMVVGMSIQRVILNWKGIALLKFYRRFRAKDWEQTILQRYWKQLNSWCKLNTIDWMLKRDKHKTNQQIKLRSKNVTKKSLGLHISVIDDIDIYYYYYWKSTVN